MRPRERAAELKLFRERERESRKKSAEVSEKWERRKMQLRERESWPRYSAVSEKVGPSN